MTESLGSKPSLDSQRRAYKATSAELMDWLEEKGTLTVAKKHFAGWLFGAKSGTLELYSDLVSTQDLALQLRVNGNYYLSIYRNEKSKGNFVDWYHLCFANQVFTDHVTVGKVRRTPESSTDEPFYYRGFDVYDLGHVKEVAARLEALKLSAVPDLSVYLDDVVAPTPQPQ